jgi:tetratricopeptide (TPR) repeat protein
MNLLRRLGCTVVILAGPMLSGHSVAGERPWRMTTTPYYRLLTQLDNGDSAAWMRQFDQFIESTADVLHLDLATLTPLTVVLFERDKDFEPYKLQRPNGLTANVAGEFMLRPTWSMIGMARESESEDTRHTLQHEATHWLMSVDQARQPAWFTEGIAEMLSTFERHGDKVNWGKVILPHLGLLRSSGTEPLAQFLTERSAISDREDHTAHFYAQAWAFTHFLMLSNDPQRRQLVPKFLQAYRTQSGEAAVQSVFGPQLKDLERDFHVFIDARSFTYMATPALPTANPPSLQPAPPALVEASLAALALGSQHYELARQHAHEAIELDSSSPDGYADLAYIALETQQFAEAVTQADAALQRDSKDGELFMLLGDSYVSGSNADKPDAARKRANMYEDAINLTPRRAECYDRLAQALLSISEPRAEDAKFLDVGLRVYPGDDWLRVGTAAVDHALGHQDAALAALDSVLKPDSTLEGWQRTAAAGVRRTWLLNAMNSEIQTAADKDNYAGARAALDRYRVRLGKDEDAASYLEQVDNSLQLRELMAKYTAALQAKDKAGARTLAAQLLARPDLPGNYRTYLQQRQKNRPASPTGGGGAAQAVRPVRSLPAAR